MEIDSLLGKESRPLALLKSMYDGYVDGFRGEDGELPPMMRLKRIHTGHVVANAALIADGEKFPPLVRETSLAAALLHDTGRYEQLRRFNTFRDSESVDHAVFSRDIVKERGWLEKAGASRPDAVLAAVECHNRRDIPQGLDPVALTASRAVRDADKLDIFRVLEELASDRDRHGDSTAFWNLPVDARPNPAVVEAIENGRPVDYQNIKSLSDFVLIQVGWMVSGLEYATSRAVCVSRGHVAFRRKFLHSLTDSPKIDEICDLAERNLGATRDAQI